MADELPNGKSNLKIKFLSIVVAALVWYAIDSNIIDITNISGDFIGKSKGESSLTDQAGQDQNASDPQ
jgi:hypothetical protein